MITVDPTRVFEVQGQVVTLICAAIPSSTLTVGNNRTVIAGVSGKRIRAMGWDAQGDAGIGAIVFKSASGGTVLTAAQYVPNGATAGLRYEKSIVDSGYFETNTGEGLFADITAFAINLNLYYIIYKVV